MKTELHLDTEDLRTSIAEILKMPNATRENFYKSENGKRILAFIHEKGQQFSNFSKAVKGTDQYATWKVAHSTIVNSRKGRPSYSVGDKDFHVVHTKHSTGHLASMGEAGHSYRPGEISEQSDKGNHYHLFEHSKGEKAVRHIGSFKDATAAHTQAHNAALFHLSSLKKDSPVLVKGIELEAMSLKPSDPEGRNWTDEDIKKVTKKIGKMPPEDRELSLQILPGPVVEIVLAKLKALAKSIRKNGLQVSDTHVLANMQSPAFNNFTESKAGKSIQDEINKPVEDRKQRKHWHVLNPDFSKHHGSFRTRKEANSFADSFKKSYRSGKYGKEYSKDDLINKPALSVVRSKADTHYATAVDAATQGGKKAASYALVMKIMKQMKPKDDTKKQDRAFSEASIASKD